VNHVKKAWKKLVKTNYQGPVVSPDWRQRDQHSLVTDKSEMNLPMTISGSAGELVDIWQEMESIAQSHVKAYNYD